MQDGTFQKSPFAGHGELAGGPPFSQEQPDVEGDTGDWHTRLQEVSALIFQTMA